MVHLFGQIRFRPSHVVLLRMLSSEERIITFTLLELDDDRRSHGRRCRLLIYLLLLFWTSHEGHGPPVWRLDDFFSGERLLGDRLNCRLAFLASLREDVSIGTQVLIHVCLKVLLSSFIVVPASLLDSIELVENVKGLGVRVLGLLLPSLHLKVLLKLTSDTVWW